MGSGLYTKNVCNIILLMVWYFTLYLDKIQVVRMEIYIMITYYYTNKHTFKD